MKISKKLLFFSLLGLLWMSSHTYAQEEGVPSVLWDQVYGSDNFDELTLMIPVQEGGYLLGGYSRGDISGEKTESTRSAEDLWLVRIDENGQLLWDKTLGGSRNDALNDMIELPDGGFLLVSFSNSPISGDKTVANGPWLIRLDAKGNKIWDKSLVSSFYRSISKLLLLPDGNVLMGGFGFVDKEGRQTENSNIVLLKIDPEANIIWRKIYGGDSTESIGDLHLLPSGDILLGGYSFSGISGDKSEISRGMDDYWLLKLDPDGEIIWDRTYGGNRREILTRILTLPNGDILLGGNSSSLASGDKSEDYYFSTINLDLDYWVLRLDSKGNKIWDKIYGAQSNDVLRDMALLPDGNILLGGNSVFVTRVRHDKTEKSRGVAEYWILKIKPNGEIIWNKIYGGTQGDDFKSLAISPEGNYVLAGDSYSGVEYEKTEPLRGNQGPDYWVLKVQPDPPSNALNVFLVDAQSDQVLQKITPNDVIDLGQLRSNYLSLDMIPTFPDSVESVEIVLEGPKNVARVENVAPYTLFGDTGDPVNYQGQNFEAGNYTLLVRPYSQKRLEGDAGKLLEIPFSIIGTAPPPIKRFVLVNAENNQDIIELKNGSKVDMALLPTQNLSIRAETAGTLNGSVSLRLFGDLKNHRQIENVAPFALFGGFPRTNYEGQIFCPGNYSISATPYQGKNLSGIQGKAQSVNFTLEGNIYGVEAIYLVDAGIDQDIAPLEMDAIYPIPQNGLAFRAETNTCVESVRFELKGPNGFKREQVESILPYALPGDTPLNDFQALDLAPGRYELILTTFSQNQAQGEGHKTQKLVFELSANKGQQPDLFQLYPNPGIENTLNIHIEDEHTALREIQVMDYSGTVYFQLLSTERDLQIELSHLRSGLYIIQVKSQKGIQKKLFLKK